MPGLVQRIATVAVLSAVLLLMLHSTAAGASEEALQLLERYRAICDTYRKRGLEDAKRQMVGLRPAAVEWSISNRTAESTATVAILCTNPGMKWTRPFLSHQQSQPNQLTR